MRGISAIVTGAAAAAAVAATALPASPAMAATGCPTKVPSWSELHNGWRFDGRGPDVGPASWFMAPSVQPAVRGNPLSGKPWFVDCQWDEAWMGARRVNDWNPRTRRYVGRVYPQYDNAFLGPVQTPSRAALISSQIARYPIPKWVGPTRLGMFQTVYDYLVRTAGQAPGAVRFLVFRRLESGNCRPYRLPDQSIYGPKVHARLVDDFARGVRAAARDGFGGPLVVIIEPDVMPSIECTLETIRGSSARRRFVDTRISEIRNAVGKFAGLPSTTVYVDAGASDYVGWKAQVKYFKRIGIQRVRGFSLNVTHYDWTRDNVAYGNRLAKALGVHFVVSTGRAGRGNLPDRLLARGYERGCNIPNAGLGPTPTVRTGSRYADAFLWLLNPGFSDGNCKSGSRSFRTPNVRWTQTLALRMIRQRCQDIHRCAGPRRLTFFE